MISGQPSTRPEEVEDHSGLSQQDVTGLGKQPDSHVRHRPFQPPARAEGVEHAIPASDDRQYRHAQVAQRVIVEDRQPLSPRPEMPVDEHQVVANSRAFGVVTGSAPPAASRMVVRRPHRPNGMSSSAATSTAHF
jgi:hypothetical protein